MRPAVISMPYQAHFVNTGVFANQFSYADCVLPISIGQKYHQGEYLEAIIHLVNQRFRSCTVILCDLLQRHTLALLHNDDEQAAYNRSIEQGKQWLKHNQRYIDQIEHLNPVRFWWDWLSTPQYTEQRTLTEHLYNSNPLIKAAFDESVRVFSKRLKPRLNQTLRHDTIKSACLAYVIEECSVMPLWVSEGFQFEVYPSKRIPAMTAIYDLCVKPHHPNLLRWTQVNLRSCESHPHTAAMAN